MHLHISLIDDLRWYWSGHSLGCGCTGLSSIAVIGKPAGTNKIFTLVFTLHLGLGC